MASCTVSQMLIDKNIDTVLKIAILETSFSILKFSNSIPIQYLTNTNSSQNLGRVSLNIPATIRVLEIINLLLLLTQQKPF